MAHSGQPVPGERSEVDRRATRDEDEAYRRAPSAAARRRGDQTWLASLGASAYLIIVALAGIGITALVVTLGGGNWAWLPVAVGVLIASVVAIAFFLVDRTSEVEKPSAERVADLEARGVRDPEKALNERLEHEQQNEVTPAAEGSERVGPAR
jgi:hypothetical protein